MNSKAYISRGAVSAARIRRMFLRAAALLLALCVLPAPYGIMGRAEPEAQRTPIVVSMGDSYSSGEGVEPFYGQELGWPACLDDPGFIAHRSKNSWSGQLRVPGLDGQLRDHPESWYFVAASGAVTWDFYRQQTVEVDRFGEKRSVPLDNQLAVLERLKDEGKQVDLVTLSLGGNDAGFSDVILQAVLNADHGILPKPNLVKQRLNQSWNDFRREGGIRDSLEDVYTNIALATGYNAETKSGGAHIIVAGYPMLLHVAHFAQGNLFFSYGEAELINKNVHDFNTEIRKLVEWCRDEKGLDIEFISVEERFRDHMAYSDDPWIWHVMLGPNDQDLKEPPAQMASSYSMHPNAQGVRAYRDAVQEAVNRWFIHRSTDAEPPADVAFRAFLNDLVKEEPVLSTDPIPAKRRLFMTMPGWTKDDLNGLLMASIDNYDTDVQSELLTLSVRTGDGADRSLTGVILRMYEYQPSTGSVVLSAEKPVPVSHAFMQTQSVSEQINCLTIRKDGVRLIVLDDCRRQGTSRGAEVTLAGYRYDGFGKFVYAVGLGFLEEETGDVRVFGAAWEPGDAVLSSTEGRNGRSGWQELARGSDAHAEACYWQFQGLLYDQLRLNGDDQRLRVNQTGSTDFNRLMCLTASDVYVDDTDNVRHLACVYNCHYDDEAPVDGASWWLYRSDDIGLLDPYRAAVGGRPVWRAEPDEGPEPPEEPQQPEVADEAEDGADVDDGEAALTDKLIEAYPGDGELLSFAWADYDGDGVQEAFALLGTYDDENFDNLAELWFVSVDRAIQCERAGGCYPFDCYVTTLDGRTCYHVSEGYFGSGGAERFWTVEDGAPRLLSGAYLLEDLSLLR